MNQRSAWDDDEQTTTTEVPSAYTHRAPDADATAPHRAQPPAYDPAPIVYRAGYDDPFVSQRGGALGRPAPAVAVVPESLREPVADPYADPFVSQRSPQESEEQRRYAEELRRYEAEKRAYDQQQAAYEAEQAAYEAQQAAAAQAEYEQKLREYEEQKRAYEQQQRDYEEQQRAYEAQVRAAEAVPVQRAPEPVRQAPRRSLPPGASTMASVERPLTMTPSVPPRQAPQVTVASPTPAPVAQQRTEAVASRPSLAPNLAGAQPEDALLFKMSDVSRPAVATKEISVEGTGMIDLFALQRAYGTSQAPPPPEPVAAAPAPVVAPPKKSSALPVILAAVAGLLLVVVLGGGGLAYTLFRPASGSVHRARVLPFSAISLPMRSTVVPEVVDEAPKAKATGGAATARTTTFTPPRPTVPKKPDRCAYCKGKLDCVIKCQSGK